MEANDQLPGWQVLRLAFVQGWSDALIAHAMTCVANRGEDPLSQMQLAADDLALSELRGDTELHSRAAKRLGFDSPDALRVFVKSNPPLSEQLGAKPAAEGDQGKLTAASWTEVVIESVQGALLVIDRAKAPAQFALGDEIVVERYGAACLVDERPVIRPHC